MAKRNLFLGFDAFGTLFRIKQPIERQYGDVARQQFPGLLAPDVGDAQLRAAFRDAFKAQSRAHPNYGHQPGGEGMGATVWWTQVIQKTFQPLLSSSSSSSSSSRSGGQVTIPHELAPRLLARFASSEGYTMDPKLPALLRAIKKENATQYGRIVVGVITNSDDRVPDVLSSFGVRVSPVRYGHPTPTETVTTAETKSYDIDLHCMSYDVGVEKPDPAIFRAAESLVPAVVGSGADLDSWDKIYVGDEESKDVVGAMAAGWYPVLLCEGQDETKSTARHISECGPQTFYDMFGPPKGDGFVAYCENAVDFLKWLASRGGESDRFGSEKEGE
ncbi:MAG: hypothetical protein STHCBS139747_004988 [Sporothrix thermara]